MHTATDDLYQMSLALIRLRVSEAIIGDKLIFPYYNYSVAKPIAAFDPVPQDLDLNSDFFVMWGIRAADGVQGSLMPHSTNPRSDIPALSQTVFNPSTGVSVTAPVRLFY